jgi:probable H4MPT-linked C1 transfer pathway protein
VRSAFGPDRVSVYSVDGRFLSLDEARREPLAVAAANWSATARLVAATRRDVILLDTGTTTTDIIPIMDGKEVALGRTDPARLASGELVYTGALRSPAEAIASQVPFRGALAGVSAEGFALAGDVHLWRGDLAPADYTVPTPDGRPATREFAGERLARVVCADREMLDDAGVSMIADALADAQMACVADAVWRVAERHPTLRTAVVTGLGSFIGAAAARRVGLEVVPLADSLGEDAARNAPAAAVALLYEQSREAAASLP